MHGQIASDTPPRKTSLFGATPLTPRPEPMGAEDQIEAPQLVVVQKTDLIVSHTANIASANNANANTTKHASIATNAAARAITETDVENFKVTEQTLNVNPAHRKVKAYWIEYKTNANYGGGTVKRIGDQAIVERMIAIITLDKKTIAGRHNELTIWEVFDVSQFLKYKRKQKNDLSDEAECFNAKPYFKA